VTTIDNGTVTIEADLVLSWNTARPSRTVVHQLIGSIEPDVTMREAGLRTGRLSMFFEAESDALFAQDELAVPAVWDQDDPPLRFVRTGSVDLSAVGPGLVRWTVECDVQEVSA
jgi:hypothetical protein